MHASSERDESKVTVQYSAAARFFFLVSVVDSYLVVVVYRFDESGNVYAASIPVNIHELEEEQILIQAIGGYQNVLVSRNHFIQQDNTGPEAIGQPCVGSQSGLISARGCLKWFGIFENAYFFQQEGSVSESGQVKTLPPKPQGGRSRSSVRRTHLDDEEEVEKKQAGPGFVIHSGGGVRVVKPEDVNEFRPNQPWHSAFSETKANLVNPKAPVLPGKPASAKQFK